MYLITNKLLSELSSGDLFKIKDKPRDLIKRMHSQRNHTDIDIRNLRIWQVLKRPLEQPHLGCLKSFIYGLL